VLASCAQTVSIDVELRPGARAVRAISRDGTLAGTSASFQLNQLYAGAEHYVLLEVEIDPALAVPGEQELGVVKVAYTRAKGGGAEAVATPIRGRFTSSDAEIKAGSDDKVAEAVLEQEVKERGRQAVDLSDKGMAAEARSLLEQNAIVLERYSKSAPAPKPELVELGKQYEALSAAPPPTPAAKGAQRKVLRELQAPTAGATSRY
jgi:hypothetical protein